MGKRRNKKDRWEQGKSFCLSSSPCIFIAKNKGVLEWWMMIAMSMMTLLSEEYRERDTKTKKQWSGTDSKNRMFSFFFFVSSSHSHTQNTQADRRTHKQNKRKKKHPLDHPLSLSQFRLVRPHPPRQSAHRVVSSELRRLCYCLLLSINSLLIFICRTFFLLCLRLCLAHHITPSSILLHSPIFSRS